jgi:hypothetical protein
MDEKEKAKLESEKKKLEQERIEFESEMKKIQNERKKFEEQKKKELAEFNEEREADYKSTKFDNILKPVMARLKSRVKEIQKLSQAKSEKIMIGSSVKWVTTKPKMFISNLVPEIHNGIGKITYQLFDLDKNGNKVLIEHKGKVRGVDGVEKEVVLSANYKIGKTVVETIENKKAILIEVFNHED